MGYIILRTDPHWAILTHTDP